MEPIAKIHTAFPGKFGIPRQSGMLKDEAFVVFEEKYRVDAALSGIEAYTYLWLIWHFSENEKNGWSPTVRPPRLGGNKRVGVFATRSSFRPNFLGLSSVRLVRVEKNKKWGTFLVVSGADMMDGTPIFDVKPYIKYADCHPDAEGSFGDELSDYSVPVVFQNKTEGKISKAQANAVRAVLEKDPRPSYHDEGRSYSFEYAGLRIRFKTENGAIAVTDIEEFKEDKANGKIRMEGHD